jgi:transcriptional regulator with XRE-family HTH domain
MRQKFDNAILKLTYIKIGRQIKLNRQHRGMTVYQLAKWIKVTPKKMRSIERGNVGKLTIFTFVRLANSFDCAFDIKFTSRAEHIKQLNKEPEIVPTFEEEKDSVKF